MTDLPKLALSVRQPWAWAIIHAGKNIENRGPVMLRHLPKPICRRVAIHAAKGMARYEYEGGRDYIEHIVGAGACPAPADLLRGGIIGSVDVVDVLTRSHSPWFMGPRGLLLDKPTPCDFIPSVGALGYFEWKPADASIVPPSARWMLPPAEPKEAAAPTVPRCSRTADLFEGNT